MVSRDKLAPCEQERMEPLCQKSQYQALLADQTCACLTLVIASQNTNLSVFERI